MIEENTSKLSDKSDKSDKSDSSDISNSSSQETSQVKGKECVPVKPSFFKKMMAFKKKMDRMKRKSSEFCLFTTFKLLRLKDESFEVRNAEVSIHMAFLSTFPAHINLLAIVLIPSFFMGFEFIQLIPVATSIFVLFLTFLLFLFCWIFKTRRLFLIHIMSFLTNTIFISSVCYTQSNMLLTAPLYMMYLLPPIFKISINAFGKNAWIVGCFILAFMFFVYQITRTAIERRTYIVGVKEAIHLFSTQFLCINIVFSYIYMYQNQSQVKIKTFKEKIHKIAQAISVLNFDSDTTSEFLETPNALCDNVTLIMKKICRNVREYKSYLPQGLIDEETRSQMTNSTGSKSQHSLDSLNTKKKNGKNGSGAGVTSPNSTLDADLEILQGSSHNSSLEDRKRILQLTEESLIDYSLLNRFGTFMLIDITNWTEILEEKRTEYMVEFYSLFVEMVYLEVKRSRGIILSLTNDKILCCWNIKNLVVTHHKDACDAALKIINLLENRKKSRLPFKACVRICICSGPVLCGNMGCKDIKTFNYFGQVVNRVFKLSSYTKKEKKKSIIIADERTNDQLKYSHSSQFLNILKLDDKEFSIFQVLGLKKEGGEDEWLYEIKDSLNESKSGEIGDEDETKEKVGEGDMEKKNIKYLKKVESYLKEEKFEKAKKAFDQCKKLPSIYSDLKDNVKHGKKSTLLL